MNDQKKAKWLLGTSGVILSAILLTQLETSSNDATDSTTAPSLKEFSKEQQQEMGNREQELVQLDWANFEVQQVQPTQTQIPYQPDRRSQRS